MVPLEPWQKVFIELDDNQTSFKDIDPTHALIGCTGCHGGTNFVSSESTDLEDRQIAKNLAHEGVIHDPSVDAVNKCGVCHSDIVERNEHSIHTMLWGQRYKVAMRAFGDEALDSLNHPIVNDAFESECTSCHTTCGQCHVSRPNSVHTGLINSHKFNKTPDMTNNCTACHSSSIGVDYFGDNDGVGICAGISGNYRDAHANKGYKCLFCHTEDLHGDGTEFIDPPQSRYSVNDIPFCTDCHEFTSYPDNLFHTKHWPGEGENNNLSCYVCHSQQYYNCNSCHTAGEWKDGYAEGDNDINTGGGGYVEFPDFKIAHNPAYNNPEGTWSPSLKAHSDCEWIVVRHSPVSHDTYSPWNSGIDELENYDQFETWAYTSPHNIRKWTARTLVDENWEGSEEPLYDESNCASACHYHDSQINPVNAGIYLTEEFIADNYPDEIDANEFVSINSSACMNSICHAEVGYNNVQNKKVNGK